MLERYQQTALRIGTRSALGQDNYRLRRLPKRKITYCDGPDGKPKWLHTNNENYIRGTLQILRRSLLRTTKWQRISKQTLMKSALERRSSTFLSHSNIVMVRCCQTLSE